MEDAESVRAICPATPTALDCTGDLVDGERFRLLWRHLLYILRHMSPLLKQNLSDLSVSVRDMQVSPSSKVRDLCVVFDQYLTFHDHICKSTHFHLRGFGRIRNLLTFDVTAQLIHALITSRLDFCNSILYNLPNKQIERLQRIQSQAARMLKRIPRRNHITPVLRELH